MYSADDTIVALATPPGRGGLGVVRLSGPRALEIARALAAGGPVLAPRHATLVRIGFSHHEPAARRGERDPDGQFIDEGIATFFPAGGSYTGEDVVELSLHGSPVVLGEVIGAAVLEGARMARAGEFTLRAFLNGRVDLTRAEAVHDLVEATTPVQARVAFDQLRGTLAERIGEIERTLFELVARLEASGDFPEEGYHFVTLEEARVAIEDVRQRVDVLLADSRRGRLLREGVSVAIAGRPNVGKSTLFNRLAGAERAIVTTVPGTTRDVLTESVMLLGTRMLLADTAGVRPTTDPIEREGVARAEKAAAAADVVVVVIDGSAPLTVEDRRVLEGSAGRLRVIALNKCDVASASAIGEAAKVAAGGAPASGKETREPGEVGAASVGDAEHEAGSGPAVVQISALTGGGIDELVRAVARVVGLGHTPEHASISNRRHIGLLESAGESLRRASGLLGVLGQTPEELLLSDLREALDSLQEVSGRRTTEDLLDAIFSQFCIGK
jgi:tRNA modification GTPase